jgi:hypothetical protein
MMMAAPQPMLFGEEFLVATAMMWSAAVSIDANVYSASSC